MIVLDSGQDDAIRARAALPLAALCGAGIMVMLAAPAAAQTGGNPTPHLSLKRTSLTTGDATGHPDGGSFSYTTAVQSGSTIGTLTSQDTTSNPNQMIMADPANPSGQGSPSPGGLGRYTATYTVNGTSASPPNDDPFNIPVFGMSCYYTTYESDWGTPPNMCKSVRINGTTYSGTVTDPYGYAGTFCNSFIAEVKLQGSGVTSGNTDIQYNAGKIVAVSSINGADGSPVVADQTVARDRTIIAGRGKHVSVDNVGNNLLANDTGGAIRGYRLDLYRGAGAAVCANAANVMGVSACTPRSATCPGYAFP